MLNQNETELLGRVYIYPPEKRAPDGADALVSCWAVDREASGELERALDDTVPRRLTDRWGFRAVHFAP